MKLAGIIVIILGVLLLVISGLADIVSNTLLGLGGILVVAGLLLYILYHRFSGR